MLRLKQWVWATALGSTLSFANPNIDWKPLIRCTGPTGEVIIDDFSFNAHGRTVFLQQLVIRSQHVNEHLAQRNLLVNEIAANYPYEVIIPLSRARDSVEEFPEVLVTDYPSISYKVDIRLPEVNLSMHSRITRGEIGNWNFKSCAKARGF